MEANDVTNSLAAILSMGMIEHTLRFQVDPTAHGCLLQVTVVSRSHLSHVLPLFPGWMVEGLLIGGVIVLEEGSAQCGDGQAAD